MRLASVVMFGAGYLVGTRAGRERYAQIVRVAQRASERLDRIADANSQRLPDEGADSGDGGARRRRAPV